MITKSEFITENVAYTKYKDLFDYNLEIINQINSALDVFDQKQIKPDTDFKGVLLAVFTKSVALFVSVHHLCNLGFGLEAALLVRALLENLIELKYLENEDKALCKMFLENPDDYRKALKRKGHLRISERAAIAKMKIHYDRRYSDLSKIVHPDYRGVLPRISDSQGKLVFDIGPSLNRVKESLLLSQYYFNLVFLYFCRSFELWDRTDIENIEKVLRETEPMMLGT